MLTRIRNANTANHATVDIPASKMKRAVADILKQEGFVSDVQLLAEGPQGTIRITLRYGPEKEKVITGLRRISRPGLRIYASKAEIPRVLGGLGLVIMSTSKGVMSGKRAKREGYGGEVLAYVW
jgi:small subunit ribosomal protein S8